MGFPLHCKMTGLSLLPQQQKQVLAKKLHLLTDYQPEVTYTKAGVSIFIKPTVHITS